MPFLGAGVILGLFTAWVERHYIGASGANFDFTFWERCLIAGRALWFYAGKLIWPADLVFVYPRWEIDAAQLTQLAWPLGAVLVLGGLLALTRWRRGPLAGGLFFAGTLFPALGFFNIYPFQYSFVADHFQYLASLGLIVPWAWAVAELTQDAKPARVAFVVVLSAGLGTLTWRQSRHYDDVVSLYQHTLVINPGAALAHVNLANLYFRAGQNDEGMRHYQTALRLTPRDPIARYNYGVICASLGRLDEARQAFEETLLLDPGYPAAHLNLGSVLTSQGQLKRAVGHLRQAAYLMPSHGEARRALGRVLLDLGHAEDAAKQLRVARALLPEDALTRRLLEVADEELARRRARGV
jgi:tetratricopeptide (TPR) repeat protein